MIPEELRNTKVRTYNSELCEKIIKKLNSLNDEIETFAIFSKYLYIDAEYEVSSGDFDFNSSPNKEIQPSDILDYEPKEPEWVYEYIYRNNDKGRLYIGTGTYTKEEINSEPHYKYVLLRKFHPDTLEEVEM